MIMAGGFEPMRQSSDNLRDAIREFRGEGPDVGLQNAGCHGSGSSRVAESGRSRRIDLSLCRREPVLRSNIWPGELESSSIRRALWPERIRAVAPAFRV